MHNNAQMAMVEQLLNPRTNAASRPSPESDARAPLDSSTDCPSEVLSTSNGGASLSALHPILTALLGRMHLRGDAAAREGTGAPPADHGPSIEGLLIELARALQIRAHLRWINVSAGQITRLISIDDVLYFQSDTKYVRVVTHEGSGLIRKSLRDLQVELDPATFWSIHRSTIVNANAVSGVARSDCGRLFVRLKKRDERLAVSEAHAHLFRLT